MTGGKGMGRAGRAKWIALVVLTGINLLNYIDRYIFSTLLVPIQRDLGLNDTQGGFLGSAFIVAYIVIAPLFGWIGDRGSRSRAMSFGVALWSVATAFSGVAHTFWSQFVTRVAVGVGESAYTVIAPSTLADHFRRASRGKIFAIYSGAIPVGSALGYVIGGLLEPRIGWERTFFVVGVPGLLLAAILLILRDPPRGQHEPEETASAAHRSFWRTALELGRNGGFAFTVLGYAAYTFVVGGMAFWMPTYIVRYFEVTLEKGNVFFGAVTVVGGFTGTLLGGWLADKWNHRSGNGYLKISIVSMVLAIPLFVMTLSMKSFESFMVVLFFLEVVLFLCISPLDAAVINCVRPQVRGMAMALNVFFIHLLGDGISRAMIGYVSDRSGLQAAIGICPWVLGLAALLWLAGLVKFWLPLAWPTGAIKVPSRQAHRGYWRGGLQENTLAAFRAAKARGAVMTELDVHVSADGVAVVVHDFDLKRIRGLDKKVAELTAAELGSLADAPRLVDVLQDPDCPRLVNIELKSGSAREQGLEISVAKAVREAGAESRVLFSSFNPFVLRRVGRYLPEVPRGLLVSERREAWNPVHLRRMWFAFWARPHLLHLEHVMVTAERMAGWRERGLSVAVWTVNDPGRIEQLDRLGVSSVISDEHFAVPAKT